MLKRKTRKSKYHVPTVDEFLCYTPRRSELQWNETEEGLVQINVPKFKSNFGKSFCNVIKKDNNFAAKMDKMGSVVWKNCDGKTTVKDILEVLKKEFPGQDDLDQRLFLFLQQMHSLNYLSL